MADSDDPKVETSAEKAYAADAQALPEIDTPELEAIAEPGANSDPIETPAKPRRGRKPKAAAVLQEAASELMTAEPVIEAPVVEAVPLPEAATKPLRARAAAKPAKPVKIPAKPAVKRSAAKRASAVPGKLAPLPVRKLAAQKIKTAPKTVTPRKAVPEKTSFISQLKEIPMDVTTTLKDAVDGAQEKTKEAFAKTTAFAGEYGEFAKGNVEAFVESGKILASGLQGLGSKFIADGKSAIETMTSEVKELSAAKTPTDFFKIQTDLLRRNFDSAIAYSSKTSEAMLKLTNDVIAPISGRVNLAVEKVRKVA